MISDWSVLNTNQFQTIVSDFQLALAHAYDIDYEKIVTNFCQHSLGHKIEQTWTDSVKPIIF